MDGSSKSDYSKAVKQLERNGVIIDPSAPYTPAENGRAERANRTLNNERNKGNTVPLVNA